MNKEPMRTATVLTVVALEFFNKFLRDHLAINEGIKTKINGVENVTKRWIIKEGINCKKKGNLSCKQAPGSPH